MVNIVREYLEHDERPAYLKPPSRDKNTPMKRKADEGGTNIPGWPEQESKDSLGGLKIREKLAYEQPSYIRDAPENCLVITVKASQITRSDKYHIGLSLQFPRMVAIRDDKPQCDALTCTQVYEKFRERNGYMQARHAKRTPTREKATRNIRRATLNPIWKPIDASAIPKRNDLFGGKEFQVIVDGGKEPGWKQEVEAKILAHGGKPVFAAVHGKTFAIVSDKYHRLVASRMTIPGFPIDVITSRWIDDCIEKNHIVAFKPVHLLYQSPTTKATMRKLCDKFGDSYTEAVTVDSLRDASPVSPHEQFPARLTR
ncbi:hypothetical protein SeLEV6574_g04496 [Synchytrium endobioticum]|uniref:BRCT domain-containing protein n=1 Tax=Synchytrium endobioticum TaxID=286115 RepID=A0A507CZ80_9FUNG|nr:hypothetical protein SeLEV6574_g04496 [Synchytrium endobioticum]